MILVHKPGMLASVQDLGRDGLRQLGICPGGALDTLALRLANRLVGNAEGAAGLELTMGNAELRFESDTRIAFMGGLPPELATPRRSEPRTAVPARSVGIGGAQTGIYPLVSPGGWQLIGRTPLALFDPQAAEPTLLRPGDRVRFVVESVEL